MEELRDAKDLLDKVALDVAKHTHEMWGLYSEALLALTDTEKGNGFHPWGKQHLDEIAIYVAIIVDCMMRDGYRPATGAPVSVPTKAAFDRIKENGTAMYSFLSYDSMAMIALLVVLIPNSLGNFTKQQFNLLHRTLVADFTAYQVNNGYVDSHLGTY